MLHPPAHFIALIRLALQPEIPEQHDTESEELVDVNVLQSDQIDKTLLLKLKGWPDEPANSGYGLLERLRKGARTHLASSSGVIDLSFPQSLKKNSKFS